MMFEKAANLR